MRSYKNQALFKFKLAQKHIQHAMTMFKDNPSDLEVLQQTRKARSLLKGASYLIACNHLRNCIINLIKEGQIKEAEIEIKRLHRYSF